jgi:hypothetical protein
MRKWAIKSYFEGFFFLLNSPSWHACKVMNNNYGRRWVHTQSSRSFVNLVENMIGKKLCI